MCPLITVYLYRPLPSLRFAYFNTSSILFWSAICKQRRHWTCPLDDINGYFKISSEWKFRFAKIFCFSPLFSGLLFRFSFLSCVVTTATVDSHSFRFSINLLFLFCVRWTCRAGREIGANDTIQMTGWVCAVGIINRCWCVAQQNPQILAEVIVVWVSFRKIDFVKNQKMLEMSSWLINGGSLSTLYLAAMIDAGSIRDN